MDTGHWQLLCDEVDELPFGFIYKIVNNTNNKKYIGKKQILSEKKLKPLRGKKRKRKKIVETDWKTYTSSSNKLNEDIKTLGKENFSFYILKWCSSKSELAYEEIKMQIHLDVLLKEDYYNGIINCRLSKIKKI